MRCVFSVGSLLALAVMVRAGFGAGVVGGTTVEVKPLVMEVVHPVRVVRRGDGVVFVDFGRDAYAKLKLDLKGVAGMAGKKIMVRLGEKLGAAEHVDRKPGGSIRFLETSVAPVEGRREYVAALTKNDGRRMPAEIGAVMPFRYAELEGLPGDVSEAALKSGVVEQLAVHYPFNDKAADFSCSDEKLNAIWDLCKYSMKATSFCGIFVDGDRERKPYEADAYINQLGWYCCTDDPGIARYTHEYLITHPTWPTEWIMYSVLTGYNDYLYTGETTSVKAFYEDLKAKTLRGLERGDGLISTVKPGVPAAVKGAVHFPVRDSLHDIVDWPAAERDGYEMAPVNTVVNAFHCRSLGLMASMAEALGKGEEAKEFRAAAAKTLESLNTKLVDAGTGLYVDGEGSKHSSLHANMFPLAFGLVPAERREKVAAFVESRGMACSVYGAQFLIEALFENGKDAAAIKLMEAPGDRSWRHMVEDVGTTITLEAWDQKYKPNQDWNHAWGAAPANLLPREVLGVEPLEAGFKRVRIAPRVTPGNPLQWAKGRVPTVKGEVSVEWRQEGRGLQVTVGLPAGVVGEMELPAAWGGRVEVDGKGAAAVKDGGMMRVEVGGGGEHRVEIGG
ncbi:MAG: alpha-L-rhamnosidase-related protein [Phycisphaerae bacterium]